MDYNLNIRPETITPLEENLGHKLFNTGSSNTFLDMSPGTKATKSKINKWDYIKLKSFCTVKKPSTQ